MHFARHLRRQLFNLLRGGGCFTTVKSCGTFLRLVQSVRFIERNDGQIMITPALVSR